MLREIYARHAADVARVARRFLGARRQAADVEDVVQEVFARAFEQVARNAFDGARRFGPYVGTIARNVAIDWARMRDRESVVDDPESLNGDTPEEIGLPTTDVEAREAVARCVVRLPAELRLIHELRYVEGRTQHAACASLAISRQQLRTRELRLLRAVRREMSSLGSARGIVKSTARSIFQPRQSAEP